MSTGGVRMGGDPITQANQVIVDPFAGFEFGRLELSLYRPQTFLSVLFSDPGLLHDLTCIGPTLRGSSGWLCGVAARS